MPDAARSRRSFSIRSAALALSLLLAWPASLGPLVAPATAGAARATSGPEAAIRELLETQRLAWNRGDLEGFMAAYWDSDSLSFYSGGSITHGWTTTRDRYQRRYQSEGHEMGTLVFELHSVEVLAKDAAIVKGGWALTMKDGNPRGLFTLVLRKVKGAGWRIVHDHTSVEAGK